MYGLPGYSNTFPLACYLPLSHISKWVHYPLLTVISANTCLALSYFPLAYDVLMHALVAVECPQILFGAQKKYKEKKCSRYKEPYIFPH